MKTLTRIATSLLFCFSVQFLAACGGGGGDGTTLQAGAGASPIADKGPAGALFTQESPVFAPGQVLEVALENVAPGELTAEINPVTDGTGTGGAGSSSTGSDGTQTGSTPVTIEQPDPDEGVVVLPTDLPPGRYTLTLHVRGNEIVLYFDVSPTGATQDARQGVADLLQNALRQLEAYLASNPADAAATALRDRLAALADSVATASPQELATWQQYFAANDLPSIDVPGSCSAATTQYKVQARKMLNTARLASWLSARHAQAPSSSSEVAALLAHARMEEAMRRLLIYADAVRQVCGGQADLDADTERAHKARDRAAAIRR